MDNSDRAAALAGFVKQINDMVMSFGLMDLIFIILILIGLIRGHRKGFSILLGNLTQMIVIVTVTFEYTEKVVKFFNASSPIVTDITRALVFLAITILCYYITKVILQAFAKVFTIQFADSIDKISGAITGVLFITLLLSFICNFVLMFSTKGFKDVFLKANMSGHLLEKAAPLTHDLVVSLVTGHGAHIKTGPTIKK